MRVELTADMYLLILALIKAHTNLKPSIHMIAFDIRGFISSLKMGGKPVYRPCFAFLVVYEMKVKVKIEKKNLNGLGRKSLNFLLMP